jgi:hypothetical protein
LSDNAGGRARFSEIGHEHGGAEHEKNADGDDEEKEPGHETDLRPLSHHTIDRGDGSRSDAEREHHAYKNFITVEFRRRHA